MLPQYCRPTMFIVITFLYFAVFCAGQVLSKDCEYSSREYQVALQPELLMGSFDDGIMQILDELTKIEKAKVIDFKVSVSSLKLKNVSVTEYIPNKSRDLNDFYVPLRFKSRRKKKDEPADIVMKTSNADPALACLPLKIAADDSKMTSKFELDVYGENGRILPKTANSFTIDLPLAFDQTSSINISYYLPDAAAKLTRSGKSIIVVPDPIGKVTMQTAEFDIRIVGEKLKATIFLLQRAGGMQSEFSFKVKDGLVDWEILLAAQQLVIEMSRMSTIALFAGEKSAQKC